MIYYYINVLLLVILLLMIFIFILNNNNYRKKNLDIKKIINAESFESIFYLYTDKAYHTIYKDNILVYSVEGLSLDEKDLLEIQKKFLTLFIILAGPSLIQIFCDYHGNIESVYKNAILRFDELYENDAIHKNTIDKHMQ